MSFVVVVFAPSQPLQLYQSDEGWGSEVGLGWQISKLLFYAQSTIMVISAWCRVGGGRWGGGGGT